MHKWFDKTWTGTWLGNLWDHWRSSFWFLPSLLTVVAVALGVGLPMVDERLNLERRQGWGWLVTTGPAARATLSSLSGALITVSGVVFSTAVVVLSLTTSQFGPRLLRSFLSRNATQTTLGVFLGASVYSLLILKSVRTAEGSAFVPHLSVAVAVVGGIGSVVIFIYFIHGVSQSIQAQSIVMAVAHDLDRAIDTLFPETLGEGAAASQNAPPTREDFGGAIPANHEGYVQGIAEEELMAAAEDYDAVIWIERRPGHFATRGVPIARVSPESALDEHLVEKVNSAFIVGGRRTPRQDVECAILELVEVAVRALSPGINDPFTANACIDRLGAALSRLAQREVPIPYRRNEAGQLRVIGCPVRFPAALDAAFNQIRQYGRAYPSVLIRLLDALAVTASLADRESDRAAILRHADMILRASERHVDEENDRGDVKERYRQLQEILTLPEAARLREDHC